MFFGPNGPVTDSLPLPYETLRGVLLRRSLSLLTETSFGMLATQNFLQAPNNVGPGMRSNQAPSTMTVVFFAPETTENTDGTNPFGNRTGGNNGSRIILRAAPPGQVQIKFAYRGLGTEENPDDNLVNTAVNVPADRAYIVTVVTGTVDGESRFFVNGVQIGGALPAARNANVTNAWRLSSIFAVETLRIVFAQEVIEELVPDAEIQAHHAAVMAYRRLYMRPDSPRFHLQHLPLGRTGGDGPRKLPNVAGSEPIPCGFNGMPDVSPLFPTIYSDAEVADYQSIPWGAVS